MRFLCMCHICVVLVCLPVSCVRVNDEVWRHRTAAFGIQAGHYDVTAGLVILSSSGVLCNLKAYNRWFLKNHIVMVPSTDNCLDCSCDNYYVILALSSLDVVGVIISAQVKQPELELLKKPDDDQKIISVPAVFVSVETHNDLKQALRRNSSLSLNLGRDGDVELGGRKETRWFSLSSIEEWLFLLFLCLLAVLIFLLGIKLCKAVKKRWRSSAIVRRNRLRQLSRIPTIQYDGLQVVNDSCVVCLEDFHNTSAVKLLTCRHGYHPRCINRWLEEHD
eukprot:UN23824